MRISDIKNLIKEMCDLTRKRKYVPILEADLSGLLFHLIITEGKPALRRVHLNTRIIGARSNKEHFDLVIGKLVVGEGGRPAVSPEVIIEIKMFSTGFTKDQYGPHFRDILERDLLKLGALKGKSATSIEFIFDEVNYLRGEYNGQFRDGKYKGWIKKKIILAERKEKAKETKIVFACKEAGKWDVSVE